MKQLVNFSYQHVLVLGLAKSGEAAAKLLKDSNVQVRINDLKANENDPKVIELKQLGMEVITGGHPLTVLDHIELVVKNPGIPYENMIVKEAMNRNIPIITEIELASRITNGPIIGITGSNGKTTTTTLIYEMLKASEKSAKLAGNIGNVATEVARTTEDETLVMELSSFQLLGIQSFKPHISILLNLFEAHLDYHKTMENYIQAKANIFRNQTSDDFFIYNADDLLIENLLLQSKVEAKLIPFSTSKKDLNNGVWCDDEKVYMNHEPIINRNEIALVGKHNLENILAAVAAALLSGASKKGIRNVLRTFTGVKHRLQFVKEVRGRKFYNDSKATNILATSKALTAFYQPTILLAGGLDRGNSFDALEPYLKENIKAMVLFGETAPKLYETAKQCGIDKVKLVDNVEQAVKEAYALSEEKDIILLSPACASWDQFRTFEERGDMFMEAVHRLE